MRSMTTPAAAWTLGLVLASGSAIAGEVIFDNFTANGSFRTDVGYVVSGDAVPYAPDEPHSHGMRFTATANGTLERIDAALQLVSGTNAVAIELWSATTTGTLGSMLGSWTTPDAMSDFGTQGEIVSFAMDGPMLHTGERYWVLARATGDTDASWMWASGATGPLVWVRPDGVPVYSNDHSPAMRVVITVPAPAGVPAVVGVLLLGVRRRR